MNRKLLSMVLTLILVVMISSIAAENNFANSYMRMGLGAKGMAMGGTGTAFMDNITAAYWNPAALANVKRFEFAAMYTDMGLDRMHNFAAIGTGFKYGYVALSWVNAAVKDIEIWDGSNNYGDTFNYIDHNINLSLALGRGKFKIGLTAKGYISDMDDDQKKGFGSDVGFLWDINQYLSIGAMMRDIYSELNDEEIPTQFCGGVAVHPIHGLTFATDLKKEKHDDDTKVSIGAEYWTGMGSDTEIGSTHSGINLEERTRWDEILSDTQGGIRLGFNDGNFAAGCGLRFKMLEINYAYITPPEELFEDSHQISLILRF